MTHPDPMPTDGPWSLTRRLLFRFAFAYLLLYNLPFPLDIIPGLDAVSGPYGKIWDFVVPQVADDVFGVYATNTPNGSGDTTFDYVQAFTFLMLALVATAAWSFLDRRRPHYRRLWDWLHVYVRFVLCATMLGYGFAKAVPTQFSPPSLDRLVQPFGDASPMGLLWTFMGASAAYTIFAGLGEMVGGFLLLARRTTLLGAIVSGGVLVNVVMLNFCYDVPVKLYSSHLLAMAIFLMLPDLGRLTNLLVLNRRAEPAPLRPLFRHRRLHIGALVARTVFVFGLSGLFIFQEWQTIHQYGRLAPKSPLHGIWRVDEFVLDGQSHPPLLTDEVRWRRLIVNRPYQAVLQSMDGTRKRHGLELAEAKKTITLTKFDDLKWSAKLSYRRPTPKLLTLSGTLDGHKFQARLSREDESQFLLTSRGFHWINEYPYNR